MGMIGINTIVFVSAMYRMSDSAAGIDGEVTPWVPMGESANAFNAFADDFLRLQNAFDLYRELSMRDTRIVKSVGTRLSDADEILSHIFSADGQGKQGM